MISHTKSNLNQTPSQSNKKPVGYLTHNEKSFAKKFSKWKQLVSSVKAIYLGLLQSDSKNNGIFRLTIDYRKVNNVTIKDANPVPKFQERLAHLSEAKYFLAIDLCSGYFQLPLDQHSRKNQLIQLWVGFFSIQCFTTKLSQWRCNISSSNWQNLNKFHRRIRTLLSRRHFDLFKNCRRAH